jgi:hypothetical protein
VDITDDTDLGFESSIVDNTLGLFGISLRAGINY